MLGTPKQRNAVREQRRQEGYALAYTALRDMVAIREASGQVLSPEESAAIAKAKEAYKMIVGLPEQERERR